MRLLLAAGGTGGHVSPAIAIAEAVRARYENPEIAFVGREGGEENNAVISRGFKLYTLEIRGLSRKISKEAIKSLSLALKSLGKAKRIIKEFSPDAIIATGGYVSWPIIKCGIKLGVPTLMHESNIYPGLVTRMLGKRCSALLLNSEESLMYLKKTENCVSVGNPLRHDFFKKSKRSARQILGIKDEEIFIVSFGGSLGSERINEAVIKIMNNYTSKVPSIRHLHSAGTRYFDRISQENRLLVKGVGGCKISPYIDDMPTALSAADIVISRSGAMTISEIAKCGCASILIPSPNVADDHQRKNAEALVKKGAAIMITEDKLDSDILENKLFDIITDKALREAMSEKVKTFHKPDTLDKICMNIEEAIGKNRSSAEN